MKNQYTSFNTLTHINKIIYFDLVFFINSLFYFNFQKKIFLPCNKQIYLPETVSYISQKHYIKYTLTYFTKEKEHFENYQFLYFHILYVSEIYEKDHCFPLKQPKALYNLNKMHHVLYCCH